jgi:PII-like signaling protein
VSEPGYKLTAYFDERDRSRGRFLADQLFDIYERHRMRTSVLLRGVVGFGQHHGLHTDRLLTLSESLPAVSIAVDSRERIEAALPDVLDVAQSGLISLERAWVGTGDGISRLPLRDEPGAAIKLTVYGGRGLRSGGQSGYVAAIDRLRAAGAAGASVLLGVDGTLHGERRRARFFARNADVPLMLLAIGDRRSLGEALPALVQVIDEPVVTVERVAVWRSEGRSFDEPEPAPERDPSGLPIWQKVMVHTEEQAHVGSRPLYVELARRLRAAGAPGTTVLRGVRGFYGEREPFADRVLSIRRNVPVHIVTIDSPAGVRRWWPVVEELTGDTGLVTSELVPASHALRDGAADGIAVARTPTAPH